jgi:hypothetical protein
LSKKAMLLTMTPHGSSCKRVAMEAISGSSSTVTGNAGALPASVGSTCARKPKGPARGDRHAEGSSALGVACVGLIDRQIEQPASFASPDGTGADASPRELPRPLRLRWHEEMAWDPSQCDGSALARAGVKRRTPEPARSAPDASLKGRVPTAIPLNKLRRCVGRMALTSC